MKTLADLKRDAKAGNLFAKMVVRCGEQCTEENTPERLKGYRQIVDANSVAIFFDSNGKKSELRIEKASLLEYNGKHITIYYAGEREPNTHEVEILQKWHNITKTEVYKRQAEIDAYTDGSSTYNQEKAFFNNYNAAYLMGLEKQAGKKLNLNTGKIIDDSIKGKIEMQYEIKIEV